MLQSYLFGIGMRNSSSGMRNFLLRNQLSLQWRGRQRQSRWVSSFSFELGLSWKELVVTLWIVIRLVHLRWHSQWIPKELLFKQKLLCFRYKQNLVIFFAPAPRLWSCQIEAQKLFCSNRSLIKRWSPLPVAHLAQHSLLHFVTKHQAIYNKSDKMLSK